MTPLIGITTYGRNDVSDYTLPTQYVESVIRAGGIALLIPPGQSNPAEILQHLHGLILTGGGDIDPQLYGEAGHESVYMVDGQRDRLEIELARRALGSTLPTLAICRGLQVVNVALGGTLHVHVPEVVGDSVIHRGPPRDPVPHPVSIEPESYLAQVMGCTASAPLSWHHQAIARFPDRLRVVARAADGIIEGVEMPDHPWFLGVQWHPELTADADPAQQRIFDALVQAARP